MLIGEKKVGGITVLSLSGRLDAETSGDLAMKFATLIEKKDFKLVLDLAELEYISSAGLRVILEATKKTRLNVGDIYLANIQEYVGKVLDISGLSSFLKICDKVEAAVADADADAKKRK